MALRQPGAVIPAPARRVGAVVVPSDTMMSGFPVFVGHNDLLARVDGDPEVDFLTGAKANHISLEKLREGGVVGGFFALFVPPSKEEEAAGTGEGGDKLPGAVSAGRAREVVARQFSSLQGIIRRSKGAVELVTSASAIEACARQGRIAALLHLEGAEAISESLEELDLYYAAGLRSLGPLWSRHNAFGYGVPIYKEGSPDSSPGLTEAGRRLVRRCEELGILVDLSHLTERGFWDVASATHMPLVATHSNAWELCRSTRNLTDEQLAAIRSTDGMVGVNFGTLFLRPDGKVTEETPLSLVIDHLQYLVDRLGVERVGFGSDFDGTVVPKEIGSAAGLPRLQEAMGAAGFSETEIRMISFENWVRLLRRVWGS